MGSIIITVLVVLWLAAMIPAAVAPFVLSRSRAEPHKDVIRPTALAVSRRSVSHVDRRSDRDRMAA